MGKEKQFGDKINTQGFDVNKGNINRNGRPVSIKTELKQILENDGMIFIPESQITDRDAEDKKGNKGIKIKVPTANSLAMKLMSWAMSNKNQSLKAIEMIIDRIDGKALQQTELNAKVEFKGGDPFKQIRENAEITENIID